MSKNEHKEIRNFWNCVADDWHIQVGDEGDGNRLLNSDPVLWRFAGNVTGLTVLDAGCGTGYLSKKLQDQGANVIGIDLSDRMIGIARGKYPDIDFRVDSASELNTVDSSQVDMVVSNYVLMDVPDLSATIEAFNRVLKSNGVAVLVFSHPCFPQGRAKVSEDGQEVNYYWDFPYFEHQKCTDASWGHFKSEFIWFHRPISDYWKAFTSMGFSIIEFEEPRVTEDRFCLATNERDLINSKVRPYSVAFKLRKNS